MKKKKSIALSLLSLMLITGCKNNSNTNSKPTNNSNQPTSTSEKSDKTSEKEKESFKITINADGVTLNDVPTEAKEGDLVTFTATLDEEKVISYITIDKENALEADKDGKYSFTMPKRAVTIDAITADKKYNINVVQVAGATVSVSTTQAKKNEIVKVRVTIGDSTKKSPIVKADDSEVTMTASESSSNTFEGEFQNTGKDMTLTTTLTDAPVKYSITDKDGDGAIVSGPTAASEGEVVTFRVGLEEGFEFAGEVKVTKDGKTEEEANVDVIKNDDGSYSFTMPSCAVTITRETTASIFKINTTIVNSETINNGIDLTLGDVTIVEYAAYKASVSVEILSNNYYTVDKVEANGVEATLNSSTGKYEFIMPSCSVDLKITTKAQRYILNLSSSDHISLEAYVKEEDQYQKAPLTGITFKTQVYIKPIILDENYGVKFITVKYTAYNTYTLSLNDDGYYTDNYYCTPSSKDYLQLDFTVEENEKMLSDEDCIAGDHVGFKITDVNTPIKYSLNTTGTGKYNSYDVTLNSYDKTDKSFSIKTISSYPSTYYGKALDEVTSYIYEDSYASNADDINYSYYVGIYLKGTQLTTNEFLADNSSTYSANKYIAHIGNENGDRYVLVDTTATVKVSLVSVKFINDETSITSNGALFEVTNGENTSYYTNTNNILTKFEKGEEATYKGTLDETEVELTTDGLSKVTIKGGEESTTITYKVSGELIYFTYNEKTYYVTLNSIEKTFEKVNFSTGYYYGISFGDYYNSNRMICINDNFTGYADSVPSYYSNTTGLSYENGLFKISSTDKFVFSNDTKTVAGYYYDSPMILSSKFTSDSTLTGKYLKNSTGDSFVATIYEAKEDNTSVYFDGKNYIFGTIDDASIIDTENSTFKFTSSDNKVYNFKNVEGKLVIDSNN